MKLDRKLWNSRLSNKEISKALDIAGGDAMLQEMIDKVIADLIEVRNPLRQNLMRKASSGSAYRVVRRTDRGTATWVDDNDSGTESEGTYTKTDFPYKTPLFEGKVTRKLQAEGATFGDLLMEEITSGMQVIRDTEEDALVNGSISVDAKQFDGLKVLLDAQAAQTVDLSGNPLTLEAMDEAIDKVEGNVDLILTSKRTARELNALLQSNQRFVDKVEVEGGFRLRSYDDAPIYRSNFVAINEGTGTNESRIYFLDSTEVFVGELTPLTFMALAKDSSQYDKFHIFEDIVLVFKNPKKAAQITGITPPTP